MKTHLGREQLTEGRFGGFKTTIVLKEHGGDKLGICTRKAAEPGAWVRRIGDKKYEKEQKKQPQQR